MLLPLPPNQSLCSGRVDTRTTGSLTPSPVRPQTLQKRSKYKTDATSDLTFKRSPQTPQKDTKKSVSPRKGSSPAKIAPSPANGSGPTQSKDGFTHSDVASKIVSFAKQLSALNKGPLLLTIVNFGYLPITYNWLCHTAKLPGVHNNVLFLVQGEDTEIRLKRRWPNVKTVTVNQSKSELNGTLRFGTVGYVRMMVRRTDLMNALIQAHVSMLLFETDFIWFENPVPDFLAMGRDKDLDLVGTVSTAYTQIMCGAFIYFRNTARMRTLWAEVTRQMHVLEGRVHSKTDGSGAPFRQNEQVFLNGLLKVCESVLLLLLI